MKCLIVTTLQRQVQLFLIPHIRMLQEMGYHVTIATSLTDKHQLTKLLPDITLLHLPFSRKVYSLSNLKAFQMLRKLFKKESFSLVHVHSPIASFFTRVAVPKTTKVVYTAHGFHFNENGSKISNRIFYLAERLAAKKTDGLIVINQDDYEKAKGLLPEDKIHYIHGIGVDATYFNPENYSVKEKERLRDSLTIPDNKIVITHVAEFNGNKRQIDIIHAAEKLKKINPNFFILLVGDGVLLEEIQSEIMNRNLIDHVRCLGFRTDIKDLLSITDIGLLVSLREGLPKSVMEMMAMQIPVVVTDIRGNRELVKEGKTGFVIPVRNPDELMNALNKLIQNNLLRNIMGENGRRDILEKYELSIILKETRNVYEAIGLKVNQEGRHPVHRDMVKI